MLQGFTARVFLWNVFPLHSYEPGEPFINRAHNARERSTGEEVLVELCLMLGPKRPVASGNDAANCLRRVVADRESAQVRHPSYGGQSDFLQQAEQGLRRVSKLAALLGRIWKDETHFDAVTA
jgi:hypothetical protein